MKKLIFLTISLLFTLCTIAQQKIGNSLIYNDTLNVPLCNVPFGQYKFIKIGDNVYKIETEIKEVKPVQKLSNCSNCLEPIDTSYRYKYSVSPAVNLKIIDFN